MQIIIWAGGMNMLTTVIIAVLAVIAVIFAGYKINKEAKADDIEKEISQIEKKNRKSSSGSKALITTCDFCGEKFNTLSNSFCPSCGGKFYKEESSVIKNYTAGYSPAKSYTSEPKQTAPQKSKSPFSSVIVVFAVISILIIVIAFIFESVDVTDYDEPYSYEGNSFWESDDEYDIDFTSDEIPEGYTEASFGIPGNSTIYDDGEINITATGFYTNEDADSYNGKTLLQYYMENNSDSDVTVQFKYSAADGSDSVVEETLYGRYSYSGYCSILPSDTVQVEKLVVSCISVYDSNNDEYIYNSVDDEDFEPVCITTDLYSDAE